MSEDFTGKVALVTGAAGGMGRATAQAFAAAGAKVVAADVAVEEGEQTAKLIRGNGGEAVFVRTDVSDAADVEAAVATAVNEYGGLDCAANMAAIETETTLLADCAEETFDRLVAVNLRSIFLCLKYEIRAMLQRGGGSIVNIASTNSVPSTAQTGGIHRHEARRDRTDQDGGHRVRGNGHPGQRSRAGCDRYSDVAWSHSGTRLGRSGGDQPDEPGRSLR